MDIRPFNRLPRRNEGLPFLRADLNKGGVTPQANYSFTGNKSISKLPPAPLFKTPTKQRSQPENNVAPSRDQAKGDGSAIRPQLAKRGPARSNPKSPRPVYSPQVARTPPSNPNWPFTLAVRESDLDPAYRATARRRSKNTMLAAALFMASSGVIMFLLGAATSALWPGVNIPHRRHAERTPGPVWSHFFPKVRTTVVDAGTGTAYDENGEVSQQQQRMWRGFADFLTARRGSFEGSDEISNNWFVDVDNATSAILVMWVAQPIPTPVTDESSAAYQATRNRIEARTRQVRRARAAWERFLETREHVIADLIQSGTAPRIYVDGQLVVGAKAAAIEKRTNRMLKLLGMPGIREMDFGGVDSTDSVTVTDNGVSNGEEGEGKGESEGERSRYEERALDALRLMEEGVIEILERAHARLFEDWDVLVTHVQGAENIEKEFIPGLLKGSARRDAWTSPLLMSLRLLRRRVERVQQTRDAMQIALARIREEFSGARLEEREDRLAEMRRAKRLLQGWMNLMTGVQEGVLFTLRRKEVESWDPGLRNASTYEATWEAWKSRNCGGTSCYDVPSVTGRVMRLFLEGNPAADVAQDEARWMAKLGHRTPCIWQRLYEEACCKDGVVSHRLKNALPQPNKD